MTSDPRAGEERKELDQAACPMCGAFMPQGEEWTGADAVAGDGVVKCPGCGEEFPMTFRRDLFLADATERLREKGYGGLEPEFAGIGEVAADMDRKSEGLPMEEVTRRGLSIPQGPEPRLEVPRLEEPGLLRAREGMPAQAPAGAHSSEREFVAMGARKPLGPAGPGPDLPPSAGVDLTDEPPKEGRKLRHQ